MRFRIFSVNKIRLYQGMDTFLVNQPPPACLQQAQIMAEQGLAAQLAGDLKRAREAYYAALALNPALWQVCFNLGLSWYPDRAHGAESIYWFRQTLARHPTHLKATMLLAECLYWQGEVQASLETILSTLPEADPQAFARWTPDEQQRLYKRQMMTESWLIKCMYALPEFSQTDLWQALRHWARRWADPLTPKVPSFTYHTQTSQRIKLGFFSQEFGAYSSRFQLEPLLAHLDRERFELHAFADAPPTPATEAFHRYFEHWHVVYELDNARCAEKIRQLGIAILCDLGGHTHPERLLLFARRPAPIQVTGLGFGLPTGLVAMDGYFTDPWLTPPAHQKNWPEKLLYLSAALHWQPPPLALPLQPRPIDRPFVFGSANAPYKLSPLTLQTWAEILKACPGSRLRLKAAPWGSSFSRAQIRARFQAAGVDPQRLELEGLSARAHHLVDFYNGIDVALDPFPYQGGITSCEALWMGVPVLSLRSRNHTGESILHAVDLQDWLAHNPQDYVWRARQIWLHPEKLHELKMGLRQRLLASPLCQMKTFAREVEAHCLDLWHSWRHHV